MKYYCAECNNQYIDRFLTISTFVKVVETGSFARAAERLGISISATSRQVAELESYLDARLLNRTTRQLSLTESGRVFHERCIQLLADLEEAEQSAHAGRITPRGTLRLTCAVTFGERHLPAAIAEFMSHHPEIRFDVELSDRAVDLVEEGFDAALRIGNIGNQNLVGHQIGVTQLICCAASSYLKRYGEPKKPKDLLVHRCLTYEYAASGDVWPFRDKNGSDLSVRISGPVHANSGQLLKALAAEGIGIACEPDFIVGPDIRAGRLKQILRCFQPRAAPIYLVYPSRRHLSAKVRAFAEFLSEWLRQGEWKV